MALLVEFLENDVADLILDLLARHGVESAEVDQPQQLLVEFDLEVGVEVLCSKCAGVTGGLESAIFFGTLRDFIRGYLVLGLADLPHDQRSSPRAPATPTSIASMSRLTADLRLISSSRTPRSIA